MLAPALVGAQARQPVTLGAAPEFPLGFTSIRGVRELSDGRVIVADGGEYRLLVLDWGARTHRAIGRVGDGPGEFRSLSVLIALTGDSTMVVDGTARRLLLLERDRFVAAVPADQALHLLQFFALNGGADARGRLLALAPIPTKSTDRVRAAYTRMPTFAESLLVVRMTRRDKRIDTLVALRGRPWGFGEFVRGDGDRRLKYNVSNPLGTSEQAWLFADGTIAVLRKEPYRVDWIAPGGEVRRGQAIEAMEPRATAADRRFAIDHEYPDFAPPVRENEFSGWPERVRAFPDDALTPLPDGRLGVQRSITRTHPQPRIDVIDRSGVRAATILLAARERLLAVGQTCAYVARKDDDDLERLSCRPLRIP